MLIVCISDTHNQLGRFNVPDGDVLIHAGDLTGLGTAKELFNQFALLAAMPHEQIMFTPGNHDWVFRRNRAYAKCSKQNFLASQF